MFAPTCIMPAPHQSWDAGAGHLLPCVSCQTVCDFRFMWNAVINTLLPNTLLHMLVPFPRTDLVSVQCRVLSTEASACTNRLLPRMHIRKRLQRYALTRSCTAPACFTRHSTTEAACPQKLRGDAQKTLTAHPTLAAKPPSICCR